MQPYGYLGSYRRLERAEQHLADVEKTASEFLDEWRDIGYLLGSGSEEGEHFDLREVDVPEELSIAAGETIYNLRTALDYLVFALSWHDSGERPANKVAEALQFPISQAEANFRSAAKRRLQGLSDEHIAMVEGYQPYRGCHWTRRLADLSNTDKHRHLLDLVGRLSPSHEQRMAVEPLEGAVPDESGRYDASEMELVFDQAKMDAAFADGTLVAESLCELCAEVRALVELFAGEFPLHPIEPAPDWPVGV